MKTIKRELNGETYKVMSGLAADIRAADDGAGEYSTTYVQVNLDKRYNTIWGDFHFSIGRNSWTEYYDKNIVTLGLFSDRNFTLNVLEDAIKYALKERETNKNYARGKKNGQA